MYPDKYRQEYLKYIMLIATHMVLRFEYWQESLAKMNWLILCASLLIDVFSFNYLVHILIFIFLIIEVLTRHIYQQRDLFLVEDWVVLFIFILLSFRHLLKARNKLVHDERQAGVMLCCIVCIILCMIAAYDLKLITLQIAVAKIYFFNVAF